jgi:DNA-binding Lrp family transcriptional regulator
VNNGQGLFVCVTEEFFKLDGMTTLDANLLALITRFRGEGSRLSNNRLAKFFNVNRRSVVRAVSKLKTSGYITDKGGHRQKRRLVASGGILSLLDRGKMPLGRDKTPPEVGVKCPKTGGNLTPISKERKKEVSTASPLPAFEGRASAVQNKVATQAERREILDKSPDSPFKRAMLARREG